MKADFEKVRHWLADAERVAVLTGAGVSKESGLPVFRGQDGLWRQYRPEQLATPEAFARDPVLVWEWYNWRRQVVARAEPNPGHYALAELGRRVPDFTLITQNVDGLHDRAVPKLRERRLLKLHGDLWRLRCLGCGQETTNHAVPLPELPPRCRCGGLLRPGVVWFGEPLPAEVLRQAMEAAARAQVFIVAGTSAAVQPAASLPLLARRAGAKIVEVNLEATPLSPLADACFLGKSGEVLPRLVETGVRQ
ncbi:MAG: NAD-dependent deacetylase [Terriglobia bacterium]